MRWLFLALVLGHAGVHAVMWTLPFAPWWLVGIVLSMGLAIYGVQAQN